MLDLRDLNYLLDDGAFKGKILNHFFSDDLSPFHFTLDTGRGRAVRLDRSKIIDAVGDEITQQAPLLDAISEPTQLDVLSKGLPTWTPRLSHLRRLELFDGRAFEDETIRNLLHAHCPNLEMLSMYHSTSREPDHALATFLSGMPPNKLTYFENHGNCGIGTETCLALNSHGQSLKELKLALNEEGILSLGLLQGCTALETLSIASDNSTVDLKATQNDVYLEIVEWLKCCTALKDVSFNNIKSAPDLVAPVLLNERVCLADLDISASKEDAMYVLKDHHDFHQALTQQPSLRQLHLRANPDPTTRDDLETVMNALCSLKALQGLRLIRISDYFSDEHIGLLARHLPDLEDLSVGGYGISDACLPGITTLKKLKAISFSGITTFTFEGIMDFIDQLGSGNSGLAVSVEYADPDSAISQEEQDLLRELMQTKVDGRFEYTLLRGTFPS